MSREYKKELLRRKMIPSLDKKEDDKMTVRRRYKKIYRLGLVMVVILLVLMLLTWFYYQRNHMFTSYETVWEIGINEGSLVGYETFGSNVLKVTRDGASYMDNKGKIIWTTIYEMKNPTVSVKGDYAAIADTQNNVIYIFDTTGIQGRATTMLPITKVAVSETGIVAAVLEEPTASHITFFRKNGTILDISITTNMADSGYPLDISLSSDGSQLMATYVFLQNGELKNRVVFYDFSEVGKSIPGRLVGGFDELFQGAFVGEVRFLGSSYSCAFSTKGLNFFSSKNLLSPAPVTQVSIEDEIQSVFYSNDYVGIIVKNNSGDYDNRMEIYKKSGELVMKKNFTYDYKKVDIDGDLVILHNQDSCKIYNMAGVLKLYTAFDFTVSKIRQGNFPNTLIITGPQVMKKIKLH